MKRQTLSNLIETGTNLATAFSAGGLFEVIESKAGAASSVTSPAILAPIGSVLLGAAGGIFLADMPYIGSAATGLAGAGSARLGALVGKKLI